MFIETVKIASPVSDDNPLGYIVINANDLGEDDALFTEPEPDPPPSPVPKSGKSKR